ncbi:hypothetical protein CEXT_593331 [Caerostris extrusa]|uniref:Uncharacterized protein n=1 Tax=Caerostris extrusa TaxID=172846 RepID=A0AAV4TXF3_CAEEX|nr:hypothetical protein CEXT_593331 [Caerostris extrusa]
MPSLSSLLRSPISMREGFSFGQFSIHKDYVYRKEGFFFFSNKAPRNSISGAALFRKRSQSFYGGKRFGCRCIRRNDPTVKLLNGRALKGWDGKTVIPFISNFFEEHWADRSELLRQPKDHEVTIGTEAVQRCFSISEDRGNTRKIVLPSMDSIRRTPITGTRVELPRRLFQGRAFGVVYGSICLLFGAFLPFLPTERSALSFVFRAQTFFRGHFILIWR